MKILHITATHLNPTGGVPVVLRELISEQNKCDGIESRILSINAPVDKMNSPYFDYLDGGKVQEYLRNNKPDIVFIHSFFHPEYITVASTLKKMNVPFVLEPHGSFGKMAMSKSHIKKVVANHTVFHSLIRDAKAYIYTNQAEKEDSVYKAPMDFVIPNGVVYSDVVNSKEKNFDQMIEPVFYYLGRYDVHHKGLDYLFDALDILESQGQKLHIIFYGTGTSEQINYVRNRISKYKIVDASEAGTIFGDDKKKALEKANILVLTSRYEGSPMTILDALTYGNPCLVTPGTNVAEEMVKNNVGWKTELNAEAIAQCFLIAQKDYKDKGKQYYCNCKKYVADNYSWDKIAAASVAAIESILKN